LQRIGPNQLFNWLWVSLRHGFVAKIARLMEYPTKVFDSHSLLVIQAALDGPLILSLQSQPIMIRRTFMRFKTIAMGTAAAVLAATPILASSASAERSQAPVSDEAELGGSSILILILGAAAVVAGIIIIADDDDEAISA
jgi:hypothetical protein